MKLALNSGSDDEVNNIMKLLIAYDGSRCAEAALDDLTLKISAWQRRGRCRCARALLG